MCTLRTDLRWAMVALAGLACLATAGRLQAEEREANARDKALELNAITGMDPLRGEVKALLEDKAAARRLVSEAARMAKEKPQPFAYNATLILATTAVGLKDYAAAETFYRLHRDQAKQLGSVQGIITAYKALIAILLEVKKYAEAEKICEEALKNQLLGGMLLRLERETDRESEAERKPIMSFVTQVRQWQIQSIAYQGDSDRAIEVIDRLFKDSANNWLSLDLKAQVYIIVGKNEQAVKTYEDELERLQNDKKLDKEDKEILIEDTRYSLSGVYIEAKQIDKAAEQLKTLLAKDPDKPKYNNDLGYIWADHDMNLAESEKLIRKAIEQERKQRRKANPNLKPEEEKDNAAYLDSLGWVLYKQKKYPEAKRYLRQAVEQEDGKHIEIYDHLADVLLALEQKAEAVAIWKKAVEATGDSKREQKRKEEVLKKIKANE
ncbi:MAG TPA: tetratricopeptide repeat protein [Gemmataceae bacterium]